uniref:Uncharacterized protein n=1 Tax=Aplanochytrium stocchinoi TaxID=215587 RepID=A0A7S3V2B1_9STRA
MNFNREEGTTSSSSSSSSNKNKKRSLENRRMLETCYPVGSIPMDGTTMMPGFISVPVGMMSQQQANQQPAQTVLIGNEVYTRASTQPNQMQQPTSIMYTDPRQPQLVYTRDMQGRMFHGYPAYQPPPVELQNQPMLDSNRQIQQHSNMPMMYSQSPSMSGTPSVVSYSLPVNSFQLPGHNLDLSKPQGHNLGLSKPQGHNLDLSEPLLEKSQYNKKQKVDGTIRRKVTKCKNKGCNRNSRGKSGLCVSHGGGRRCKKCLVRSARPYSEYCSAHGGGQRCRAPNCTKGAVNKTSFCRRHRMEQTSNASSGTI